jgi:hypothetical protein
MKDLALTQMFQIGSWERVEVLDMAGVSTLSLSSTSSDISKAVDVTVNGVSSPSIVSSGPFKLLAQVPDLIKGKLINNIEVRMRRKTTTRISRLTFQADYLSDVSGLTRLVQSFSVNLLRRKERGKLGSDKIPAGNLRALIGSNISTEQEATEAVATAVDTVTEMMIRFQDPLADASETLQGTNLLSVSVAKGGDITAEIRLRNRGGRSAQFAMEL